MNQSKYLAIDQTAENLTRDEDDHSTMIKYSVHQKVAHEKIPNTVIQEYTSQNPLRYHFTPNRMTITIITK